MLQLPGRACSRRARADDGRYAELREWRVGMPTLVSQTWPSYAHPDNPNDDKLRLLKSFLKEAAAGRMTVCGSMEAEGTYGRRVRLSQQTRTIAWVWFDFWSAPQADPVFQAAAIATLPSYDPPTSSSC